MQRLLAEMIGTAFLVFIGAGQAFAAEFVGTVLLVFTVILVFTVLGGSINLARIIGLTLVQQLPVYLAAELLAGTLVFTAVSRTRADATASEPVAQTADV